MAVFITGDTHGDFTRFKKDIFCEQAELTKDDCVIIAGDFGGVWDGSRQQAGEALAGLAGSEALRHPVRIRQP